MRCPVVIQRPDLTASWRYRSAMGKYVDLKGASQIFMSPNKNHNEVEQAGNEAPAIIYACKQGTYLSLERASKLSEKVASSSRYVPPECLPPTTDAAKFHSRRVYHQVQVGQGNSMAATEWGWEEFQTRLRNVLKPQRRDNVATPAHALAKNLLQCTLACGQCKGTTCVNSQSVDEVSDIDD